MEISKNTDLHVFYQKAKEVMENTEAIIKKIMVQGEKNKKSRIGNEVSFEMENGLHVNMYPKFTYIGNLPYSISHPEDGHYNGIFLISINNWLEHRVELEGVENDRVIFSASITRKTNGDWKLDNDASFSHLDTNDWSLFDVARRSIEEFYNIEKLNNDYYWKKKIGNMPSKEEIINKFNQFEDMLGVKDLKRSGNTRQWLITGLIEQINKYHFTPEEVKELIKRLNEIELQNNQQSSGQVGEEGR